MNRLVVVFFLILFPRLGLADGYLNFAPSAQDYSVVFLGNLFGVVDGVLSGTGSQIMGAMFGVFNAAVLAIGGIIILYTLIVATMNTAHEGQMLGQKWSSIWIPIRSTIGLALLIPKASGYCLMQIFIMWVVLQGVGAADRVWDAALDYLNKGGVIIHAQLSNPADRLTNSNAGSVPVTTAAEVILAGQVCMIGVQDLLTTLRQDYLKTAKTSGACNLDGNSDEDMKKFCQNPVPDFLGSVNSVVYQNQVDSQATKQTNGGVTSYSLPMPNFDSKPYSNLNGMCGHIKWQFVGNVATIDTNQLNSKLLEEVLGKFKLTGSLSVSVSEVANQLTNLQSVKLNSDDLDAIRISRAVAIQQMYMNLSSVARRFVNNSPEITGRKTESQSLGIPLTLNGLKCTSYSLDCMSWGSDGSGGALFNGTEIYAAVNAYNNLMRPVINLRNQFRLTNNDVASKAFIAGASAQGWIMAGSYFHDLVRLNGNAADNTDMLDTNTGLDSSSFDVGRLTSAFGVSGNCVPVPDQNAESLCIWFQGDSTNLKNLVKLINLGKATTVPQYSADLVLDENDTLFAFINNSLMMRTPGQPGLASLDFANLVHINMSKNVDHLQPNHDWDCGNIGIWPAKICLSSIMGELLYNGLYVFIYNTLVDAFGSLINKIVTAFLMVPLNGMAVIFKSGLMVLSQPGVNPIVALANMGNQFINFSGNLWIMLLFETITAILMLPFGIFIFGMLAFAMPLLTTWVGVMVGVGFVTTYYIPIMPFMIFLFGAFSWLIAVVEAMVAGPIVALGITHPEGHDAFGKGEAAIMILLNVFLRPAMMIIGYIAAIALTYVGVWMLNAGYNHAIAFIQTDTRLPAVSMQVPDANGQLQTLLEMPSGTGGLTNWAGVFAFFFSILTYVSMYLILVQKAFTLIAYLPDKVLRWVGGNPESLGQESQQWGEEIKQQGKEAGKSTKDTQDQMSRQAGGKAMGVLDKVGGKIGKAMGGSGTTEAEPDKGGGKTPKG